MSQKKKILMFVSAILMIVSGLVTGILCCLAIFQPGRLEPIIQKYVNADSSNWDTVASRIQLLVSLCTAGSVVGIVFGGISIKFCMYQPIEFYQKRSVVLTVAIICTIVVNPLVGALYIVAVMIKDDNLRFGDEPEENKPEDIDKLMEKIEKLSKMKEQNLINDDEFAKLKADILKGTSLDKSTTEKSKPEEKPVSEESSKEESK